MDNTTGQWSVPLDSGQYHWTVVSTTGQWSVPLDSGQYHWTVVSTTGQWTISLDSGQCHWTVISTTGQWSIPLDSTTGQYHWTVPLDSTTGQLVVSTTGQWTVPLDSGQYHWTVVNTCLFKHGILKLVTSAHNHRCYPGMLAWVRWAALIRIISYITSSDTLINSKLYFTHVIFSNIQVYLTDHLTSQ